jgi:hypothetical protein
VWRGSRPPQQQCIGDVLRLIFFFKLLILSLCISLLSFALLPDATITGTLKVMALGIVISIGITVFYPEVRGVKEGDPVAVVSESAIPGIVGRVGRAMADGRKNDQIKIVLNNGAEIVGIIESYGGLLSPPKIKIVYEEKLVE